MLLSGREVPDIVEGFGSKSYVGYRHMCRFFAGVVTSHPALMGYRYIWRLDADAQYFCPIDENPFQVMHQNNKVYGYTIMLKEHTKRAGDSLWISVNNYISRMPRLMAPVARQRLARRANIEGNYNRCHYWNNFEILDLDFFRSSTYTDFFQFLESEEGIWFDRWGDALIRTLAVDMFLDPSQVMQFQTIGYSHHGVCRKPCGATNASCHVVHVGDTENLFDCGPDVYYRVDQ